MKFVAYLGSRAVMVLVSVGAWAGAAAAAKAVMRPVFDGGVLTLQTQTKQKRATALNRVIVSTWLYAMVFVLAWTAFSGASILKRDPSDFFGFQEHVLSTEYLVHPAYAALIGAAALSAIVASLVHFALRSRNGAVGGDAFDAAWGSGLAAFFAVGLVGQTYSMWLRSADA